MSTTLRIRNTYTYIEGDFPKKVVDIGLSYMAKGFFMSPLYNTCQKCKTKIKPKASKCQVCNTPRAWDGRIKFLKGGLKGIPYFPTGLLSVVVSILTQMGYKPIFVDERAQPTEMNVEAAEEAYNVKLIGRDLWREQQDAIYAGLMAGRGVIQSPTASGKTSIMAGIIKLIHEPGIIFIHNTTIASQLQQELEALTGEHIGLIKGGVFDVQRITVAMTQSLYDGLSLDKESRDKKIPPNPEIIKLLENAKLLMLDEAHHGSSKTWSALANRMINAYYRLGVTGTAFMRPGGDDMVLIGVTGGLIYEASEQSLIDQGKIAKPIIHMYVVEEPGNIKELPYQQAYDLGVVKNQYINTIATQSIRNLLKQNQQILVLCERLEHIQNIAELLSDIPHDILTGETSHEDREEVKDKFAAGKKHLILASTIFDEGVSINNIDWVFRMGLMKTAIKTKQQVGRGQRKKHDKPNIVRIVDWIHNTNDYLKEHSTAHYKQYLQLGYQIVIETSPIDIIAEESV